MDRRRRRDVATDAGAEAEADGETLSEDRAKTAGVSENGTDADTALRQPDAEAEFWTDDTTDAWVEAAAEADTEATSETTLHHIFQTKANVCGVRWRQEKRKTRI